MKVVTVDQMRAIERRSEDAGVSTAELMEHAGKAVADEALAVLGNPRDKRVLVLVGPGNNGGDGLVGARHLHDAGAVVALYLHSGNVAQPHHLEAAVQRGVRVLHGVADAEGDDLRRELARADLIVDALLGTGRARPPAGRLKAVLDAVSQGRRPGSLLLAVDLPTGLDADTGFVDESALRADVTVTLGFPKVGLFAFPGAAYVGRLVVADIGLPANLDADVKVALTSPEEVAAMLPERPAGGHKGTFGNVMVAGGSANYVGAPALAATAAGRVGAGLVTLACARSLHPVFAAKLTEATFVLLPEAEYGVLGLEAVQTLERDLSDYDVLLLGPGLGRADVTRQFVRALVQEHKTRAGAQGDPRANRDALLAPSFPDTVSSLVIDADGLNALAAQGPSGWAGLPPGTVLTPHSGEMSRLMGVPVAVVDANRLGNALEVANRSGAVVVLKGAFTIIAAPDGRARINPDANPALATAGTGDVLAGAIAGLLAQGLEAFPASVAAVYLHGRAGALAAHHFGDAGVLASDLLPLLPQAVKRARLAGKPEA